jgi:hypothetical protein
MTLTEGAQVSIDIDEVSRVHGTDLGGVTVGP